MRLIVDTNQADPIRFTHKRLQRRDYPTLVIPFLVLVELLEGRDAEKRRRALQKFPLIFGMELGTILDELAKRSETQIRSFVPIYPKHSDDHEQFAKTFLHPTRDQVKIANKVRENGKKYRQRMLDELPRLHKKHKEQNSAAKSRGESVQYEDWESIHDGNKKLFLIENGPCRQWWIDQVTKDAKGNPREIKAKSGHTMFDAVWDNPILRRFVMLHALVHLGYAQKVWEDHKLNKQVRIDHDDMPDISLVLYARNGDTILTADRPSKDRIRRVDAEKNVNLATWNEWLAVETESAELPTKQVATD